MIGTTMRMMPAKTREHSQDRDQHRGPAGQLAPFEQRDDRVEAEREEQRGADVEQDRREGLDAADEQQPEPDAQRRDERDAEWVVHLHGGSCLSRRGCDCCHVRIRTGRAQAGIGHLPGAFQVSFASLKCRVDGPLHSPAGPGEVLFVRFVWAVAAFVLAAVMIGAGIAQRTVFQGPEVRDRVDLGRGGRSVSPDRRRGPQPAPGCPDAARAGRGRHLRRVRPHGRHARPGSPTRRTTRSSLDGDGKIVIGCRRARAVEDEPTTRRRRARGSDAAPTRDAEARRPRAARSARTCGSTSSSRSDLLIAPLQLPDDMSVLVATDGDSRRAVRGQRHVADRQRDAVGRPAHRRRRHPDGDRRVPVHPRHPSRPPFARPASQGSAARRSPSPSTSRSRAPTRASSAPTPPTRRAVSSGERAFVVVPAVAVSALLFTGCSADSWPQLGRVADADARPRRHRAGGPAGARRHQGPGRAHHRPHRRRPPPTPTRRWTRRSPRPAWTARCSPTRATNYALRGAIADYKAPAADPDQAARDRPAAGVRRLAALGDGRRRRRGRRRPSSIMVLTQEDAWSPYKLSYQASLEASTQMPDLAPAYIGAHAGAAGLVVPRDAARAGRGRVRRHHQQRRGQRVLRPVRGRGRPVPRRASPPTASSASPSSTRPPRTTGSLTFDAVAGRARAARPRDARERRDRRRERQRDRHGQADERRRGDQARQQPDGEDPRRRRAVRDGLHHDLQRSALLLRARARARTRRSVCSATLPTSSTRR